MNRNLRVLKDAAHLKKKDALKALIEILKWASF
jgi:hypothetical protein